MYAIVGSGINAIAELAYYFNIKSRRIFAILCQRGPVNQGIYFRPGQNLVARRAVKGAVSVIISKRFRDDMHAELVAARGDQVADFRKYLRRHILDIEYITDIFIRPQAGPSIRVFAFRDICCEFFVYILQCL